LRWPEIPDVPKVAGTVDFGKICVRCVRLLMPVLPECKNRSLSTLLRQPRVKLRARPKSDVSTEVNARDSVLLRSARSTPGSNPALGYSPSFCQLPRVDQLRYSGQRRDICRLRCHVFNLLHRTSVGLTAVLNPNLTAVWTPRIFNPLRLYVCSLFLPSATYIRDRVSTSCARVLSNPGFGDAPSLGQFFRC
jgi:hypothetical protein